MDPRGVNGDRQDWLISDLRRRPRTARMEELLFHEGAPLARLEAVETAVAGLRGRVGRVEGRVERLAAEARAGAVPDGHLLFVPGPDGYRLVELDGAAPAAGDRLLLDDRVYLVVRGGRSPLPRDRRRCAFLQPLAE